jgi:hypothetical protein
VHFMMRGIETTGRSYKESTFTPERRTKAFYSLS